MKDVLVYFSLFPNFLQILALPFAVHESKLFTTHYFAIKRALNPYSTEFYLREINFRLLIQVSMRLLETLLCKFYIATPGEKPTTGTNECYLFCHSHYKLTKKVNVFARRSLPCELLLCYSYGPLSCNDTIKATEIQNTPCLLSGSLF